MVDLGLIGAEDHHRRDIARPFGEYDVARIDEELAEQLESVLRSRRDHDIVGAPADALERHHLEDLLAQSRDALARTVLEGDRALLAHDPVHGSDDQVLREGGDERHPAGQGDDLGAGGHGEQGSHFAGGQAARPLRVVAVPPVEIVALRSRAALICHLSSVLNAVANAICGDPDAENRGCFTWNAGYKERPARRVPDGSVRTGSSATRGRRRGRLRGQASAWHR